MRTLTLAKVPADTPVQVAPTFYRGENKAYPPSTNIFLNYATMKQGDQNVPDYKNFRKVKNSPLFVDHATNLDAEITPENIKQRLHKDSYCQILIGLSGWQFSVKSIDGKFSNPLFYPIMLNFMTFQGIQTVVVRLKLEPRTISVSDYEAEEEFDFRKFNQEVKAKQSDQNLKRSSDSIEPGMYEVYAKATRQR